MGKVINIESVKETRLYQELISRDNEDTKSFVANIPTLCEEANDRAKNVPIFFSQYTLHDKTHFIRVTELMAKIIGSNIQTLNDIEIGLLILSAFFHDQGMLIDKSEYQDLEENSDFKVYRDKWYIEHSNYLEIKKQLSLSFISNQEKENLHKILYELDAALLTDYLRETHGSRAHKYILDTYANERILAVSGSNLAPYLAEICLSHVQSTDWVINDSDLKFDENIGSYKVNTIYVALALRLADILDFDSDRTPDVLFKSIHFTSPISVTEWQKHRSVNGWEISSNLVRFSMSFEHPVYEKTAHQFLDWIDEELNSTHSLLRKFPKQIADYNLSIAEKVDRSRLGPLNNSYIYHDLEFTISRNEIVRLLMTDNLYKNSSLFIRELLQNSLDALRLRRAIFKKDGIEWKEGEVIFRHYVDSNKQHIVECRDNGSGMDELIINNFLGKVGRSYYRSPEFERQRTLLKESGADFDPCSKFGIGFMSCFMIGDRIEILTRKDYGQGKEYGKPLIIEINGLGGLIVIKEGKANQKIGTTVRVFSREKPIVYDRWSDQIRLILTLKGYALATEFPIEAKCELDEIEETFTIPSIIDKKQTFLESLNLSSKKVIEIDFNTVNKSLSGFLRQSFLVDKKGIPCIENEEAVWQTQIDNKTWKDKEKINMTLLVKKDNIAHVYDTMHGLDKGISICCDGILVCGYPGRKEYPKEEMFGLGHISPKVNSEHPFTIDVRGDLKPELSPAREPVDRGNIFSSPIGWKKLRSHINKAGGHIWEKILDYSEQGLTAEVFWKLLAIYDGSPFYIKSQTLFKYLSVPIKGKNWISLSKIAFFEKNDANISVEDSDQGKFIVEFPEEILTLAKAPINGIDVKYWITNVLTSMSNLKYSDGKFKLQMRNSFDENELPIDSFIIGSFNGLRHVSFTGLDYSYFLTFHFPKLLNSENPIVKVVVENDLTDSKEELVEFSKSFIYSFCDLIDSLEKDGETFDFDKKWRVLKRPSLLYQNIDWDKYKDEVTPPYRVLDKNGDTIEIEKKHFDFWAGITN